MRRARLQFWPFERLCGHDVLIETQHVMGVVLLLDLSQAGIVRPVAPPDKLVAGIKNQA